MTNIYETNFMIVMEQRLEQNMNLILSHIAAPWAGFINSGLDVSQFYSGAAMARFSRSNGNLIIKSIWLTNIKIDFYIRLKDNKKKFDYQAKLS